MGKWTADLTGVHPIYHSLMHKKNLPYLTDHPHVALPMECFAVGQVRERARAWMDGRSRN